MIFPKKDNGKDSGKDNGEDITEENSFSKREKTMARTSAESGLTPDPELPAETTAKPPISGAAILQTTIPVCSAAGAVANAAAKSAAPINAAGSSSDRTADQVAGSAVRRLPPWLKKRLPAGGVVESTAHLLEQLNLTTVCDGAHCPNRAECFQCRTATFMILGERCTRNCRFCAIEPTAQPLPPDPNEPENVAQAVKILGLKHVVVTSVTRDDLSDGGAGHFARTIRAIKQTNPEASVEVLTPDFKGNRRALETVLEAGCEVFNHNVETIPRLYAAVRPQADFQQSLTVLSNASEWFQKHGYSNRCTSSAGVRYTKSGFMVGLGETDEEVYDLLVRLRSAQIDIVTIGQYLAPSREHFPVQRYVPPETFAQWEVLGRDLGFRSVFAGPFVRSSYHAGLIMEQAHARRD